MSGFAGAADRVLPPLGHRRRRTVARPPTGYGDRSIHANVSGQGIGSSDRRARRMPTLGAMARPCRIGVQLPEVERRVPWPELKAMARAAESVGFDSLWLGDHLLYDLDGGVTRGPWEVWTTLAALAAVTERVELGPLVASAGFHAPAMLAKQAATVDGISGGRLILGLGAGWNEREYRAFGFPFDRRVDRFAEAFTIISTLLRDGRIDFTGEFYRLEDCVLDPPPTRPSGPPLMVGSIGPRMLAIPCRSSTAGTCGGASTATRSTDSWPNGNGWRRPSPLRVVSRAPSRRRRRC